VAVARKQANADRVATSHQSVAVVFDLVDPIGTGQRSAVEGKQGSMKPERTQQDAGT
jgi:hypothetical protein